MIEIPVLPGDGIGPEIVGATRRVLEEACGKAGATVQFVELPCGLEAIRSHGTTIPAETLERLDASPGWILGPLSTHLYAGPPGQPNVSALLRRRYDLHANIRPVRRLLPAGSSLVSANLDLDVVIVRENTQGFYADRNMHDGNGEMLPSPDLALALRVITRQASEKVARVAFDLAGQRSGRVTVVHKANVLRKSDGLFLEACRAISTAYPGIRMNDLHVDAAATILITDPQAFDVVVTTNMFGDILSNEGAGLVGGLGLAPSLNQGGRHAMAQASHGSAPSLAGTGRANPVALLLSAQMLLRWWALRDNDAALADAAARLDHAVVTGLAESERAALTPDLGGTGTTATLTDAIMMNL